MRQWFSAHPKKFFKEMTSMFKQVAVAFALACVLWVAFPMAVSASVAAITSFHMDRTTVNPGQSITFTVRTTAATTHVFTNVGGTTTHGTIVDTDVVGGTRLWSLTAAAPAGTTQIVVFANTANNTLGAATITIPITVGIGTANLPGGHGPLAIISVIETAATAPNMVQLTVITGPEASEVWVRHGGMYNRGTMTAENLQAQTRTWVINFRPTNFVRQQVEVFANRAYVVAGATRREFQVELSAPFLTPSNPLIINAIANPTSINPGGASTVTVTTNNDAEFVWIMVGGTRINAVRSGTTVTQRTWTATVHPATTMDVVVHANATNVTQGAAVRNVRIDVGTARATIHSARAEWDATNSARVTVYTNQHAGRVWIQMGGGTPRQFPIANRQNVGGNQFRWVLSNIHDPTVPIRVFVSESTTGAMTQANADAFWDIPGIGGWADGTGVGMIHSATATPMSINLNQSLTANLTVVTAGNVTEIRTRSSFAGGVWDTRNTGFTNNADGTRTWSFPAWLGTVPSGSSHTVTFEVQARTSTAASWSATTNITGIHVFR
jgi:hypothetical protein